MSQITDAHKIFGVPNFSDFFGGGIVVWKGEQAPPSHVAMFDGEERRIKERLIDADILMEVFKDDTE